MIENNDSFSTGIIGSIQTGFPASEHPFREIGNRLGMSEDDLIKAVQSLLDSGVIRAFGPVFDPRKLGYVSTLVAVNIDQDRVAELAAVLLDIREVTHNYLRDHDLNLWFTITALTDEIIDGIIKYVEKFPGVRRVMNLPAVTIYKIRAVFGIDEGAWAGNQTNTGDLPRLDDRDKAIVRASQEGFPIADRPYRVIAEKSGLTETEVISRMNRMIEQGVIRRFGARLNHQRAGYGTNSLGVWRGDEIDALGALFSGLSYVSHCYRRTPYNDWPYELYTMIHAVSSGDMKDKQNEMRSLAPGARPLFLKSLYELKKSSMKYFLEKTDKKDRRIGAIPLS